MTKKTEIYSPVFGVLLRSSHVCAGWRKLILSSPSLWGQVINLKFLDKDDVRNEIMHRTGYALLSVTAEHNSRAIPGLLLTFLQENWERIRFLNIFIGDRSNWGQIKDDFWRLVTRPAQFLETSLFEIHVLDLAAPDGLLLFNNQAPALRKFFSPAAISLTAPWLTHINDLSIRGPLPVDKFIQALQSMPCLETLRDLSDSITAAAQPLTSLPKISHPSLHRIVLEIRSDIRPYLDLLGHLMLPTIPKCRLQLSIYAASHRAWTGEDWDAVAEIVRLFPNFCGLADANSCHLALHRVKFSLSASFPSRGRSSFGFQFMRDPVEISQTHMSAFFRELMPFHPLRDLHHLSLVATQSPVLSAFDQASFNYLSSVQPLVTTVHSMQCLTDLFTSPTADSPVMFPALQTVYLNSCPEKTDIPSMKLFLTSRIRIGKPLGTLVIKRISYRFGRNQRTIDMRWLDQFTGLKVVFQRDHERDEEGMDKKMEHICGRSDVKKLAKLPIDQY